MKNIVFFEIELWTRFIQVIFPLCYKLPVRFVGFVSILKHKDSFGKSENLSKIFFAEILVFDHDYEGKSSSSNGLLWISFF